MRRFILLLIVTFLSVLPALSQSLHGKVLDKKTHQPLPFVSIFIKKTQRGTLTDIDGKFHFPLNPGESEDIIQLSYLGYKPYAFQLKDVKDTAQMLLEMVPEAVNLSEIKVVAGENPAHRIIRQASKMRDQNNPEKMQSFSYHSYNKCFITADMQASIDSVTNIDTSFAAMQKFFSKQHLFLLESITQRDFMKPDRNLETVMASRVSGFKNSPFAIMATQLQSFTFYDDFISVLDEKYVNPISSGSTRKYLFLIQDTILQGKDTVFVISFEPRKGKNFNALKGVLYISTNGYAIQNVIAEPVRPDNYQLSIKVQQKYEFIDNKQWFPVQLNTDWIWKNATISSKKDPTKKAFMKAVSRSYIKEIEVNPKLSRKEFSEVTVQMDKNLDKQGDTFWNQYRIDTLSSKEQNTYHTIDSLGKAENLDKKLFILDALINNRIPLGIIDLNLDKILKVNSFEQARVGLGFHTNQKFSKIFTIGGYGGFGFGDQKWKYGGDLSFMLWKKKELSIFGSYDNTLVESGGTSFFENTRNLRSSESFRDAYVSLFDYMQKYEAGFKLRAFKYLRANIFANHQQRHGPTTFGTTSPEGITTFRDTFNFNETGVQLKFLYKEKFLQTLKSKISMGSDYPVLYLNVVKGYGQSFFNLPGDFDYWKFDFRFEASRTFLNIGTSNLSVFAGKVIGILPYTMLYNNRGSLWGKYNASCANSFETMGLNEFASNQYASLFFSHNIGRFLPIRKKFNPELEIVHNMGIGTLNQPLRIFNVSVSDMSKGYFESGMRILHILKNGANTYGIGVFYRYGPYQLANPADNLAIKLVLSFKI